MAANRKLTGSFMQNILLLILFPLLIALLCLLVRKPLLRDGVVIAGAAGICAASLALPVTNFHKEIVYFAVELPFVDKLMFLGELAMGVYMLFLAARSRRKLAVFLLALQFLLMFFLEAGAAHRVSAEYSLFVDKLSIIMTMVIGIIGSLICVYATGYMRDFHRHFHNELPDKRGWFFFIIFIFMSAMFGLVFSNNLKWLYFFWEVTTFSSFILIGYKQSEEAQKSAFRALNYNLLGGLFLSAAIWYLSSLGVAELSKISFEAKSAVMLPVALISIAGLIKSAQMPFSSWLLGAMVAPTPVSALLHSSTMVKAGVYIIVRFAAILQGSLVGFMLSLVGGLTFLVGSLIAVTQSDAKKILAYSTIANLGLIVLCAGVGTYEALWAAALLIIFHALAKCLLFLCVGTIEHKVGSRDIEQMAGLVVSMPKISIMVQIGMAGMFLAPFGMLISKWAVLKALVDYNPLLAVFVVFGSSVSLLFWVKWMGKLITVTEEKERLEDGVHSSEWLSLGALAALTVGVCGFFPAVSAFLIEPYVIEIYGRTFTMSHGNVVIMAIMLGMLALFPLSFINYGKRVKVVDAYLGGANADSHTQFHGAGYAVKDMELRSYYLTKYFGEARLFKYGVIVSLALLAVMLVLSRP